MHAFLTMSLSVLLWSLYPLGAVVALKTMSGYELVAIATFFSVLGSLIAAMIHFKKGQLAEIIAIHKNVNKTFYLQAFASGATNVMCHGMFFLALTLTHKGGASLLYESWPIIAVIATPFLMRKAWREVSFRQFMVCLVALFGIGLIIFSNDEIDFTLKPGTLGQKTDYTALLGYVAAFVGAYACAICVVLKGVVAEYFEKASNTIGATIISELYSRGISMIIILALFPFAIGEMNFDTVNWGASIFIGLTVMVVGGILYTYSLLKTDNPTIHILYYMVPFLAVVWLWLAGETDVNTGLFVGGTIVILCNIYLAWAGRKSPLPPAVN